MHKTLNWNQISTRTVNGKAGNIVHLVVQCICTVHSRPTQRWHEVGFSFAHSPISSRPNIFDRHFLLGTAFSRCHHSLKKLPGNYMQWICTLHKRCSWGKKATWTSKNWPCFFGGRPRITDDPLLMHHNSILSDLFAYHMWENFYLSGNRMKQEGE